MTAASTTSGSEQACSVDLIVTAEESVKWFTWTQVDGSVTGRLVIGTACVHLTPEGLRFLAAELGRSKVEAIAIGTLVIDPEDRTQSARLLKAVCDLERAVTEVMT